ncbi:LOW QUALITY PROTEIN: SLC2A4 regulator [Molothrus ater]|uniref:LOW QUALITY PROTEIN: SLC2A4 regulator n=1 Tax=Molothrus ater TaxID=84834 RepID=UPI0023E79D61|nr:LOW QUALITY PROTEIN: SLC2A4 regulator [Molothrus ater]
MAAAGGGVARPAGGARPAGEGGGVAAASEVAADLGQSAARRAAAAFQPARSGQCGIRSVPEPGQRVPVSGWPGGHECAPSAGIAAGSRVIRSEREKLGVWIHKVQIYTGISSNPAPQNPAPHPTEAVGILADPSARGDPCCPLPCLPQAPLGPEGWLGEPPSRQEEEAVLRALDAGLERCLALHSAVQCIPVPRHRKLSGKAGIDEVMAAAVLTSLSASPLVLGHPPATHATEPGSEVWKEAPAMSSSCSSSSNTSGDWSWDPSSDRSTPSTPSPPLSSHVPSTFLPGPLPDEGPDEPDGTHFVFGEPTPRKRKNSTKVMFKCLWKSCGKVLSSSSGMQKHIRTMHLGRKADLEQSDGEEDFYYTELDVDMEALTDGLSSLTPVSPTSSVPPAFPGPEAPLPPALPILELALASPCSPPGPPGRCHVHTDHAYQGCRTPPRPPVSPTVPTPPPPKPPAVPRRPRGEAKKCRKVYGMEHREMWCTACRWKKACQRFLD